MRRFFFPLYIAFFCVAAVSSFAPVQAGETWFEQAHALAGHAKVLDQQAAMEAFARGDGQGEFIVLLKRPKGVQNLTGPLQANTDKDVRRQEVRSVRDRALQAMPDLPRSVIRHRYDNLFGFSVQVDPDQLQLLLDNPHVDLIEPVRILYPHLRQGIPLQKADTYRSQYNGQGVSVAIVDTGIDYNNPYINGGTGGFPNAKVIGGYDFGEFKADPMDRNGHGTACAGIVAGEPCDSCGDYIGGVAYNAKLYALKISSTPTGGTATTAAMIAAWDWAVTHQNDDPSHPIMVISTSFGGGRHLGACDAASPGMTQAANNAVAAGITVFSSSGNDGYCDAMGWPACISSVISVGAVYDGDIGRQGWYVEAESCAPKIPDSGKWVAYDETTAADMVAVYSNSASFLDIFAPSNDAYTLQALSKGSAFAPEFGGTSAACPYAAGAAAVLQSAAKKRNGRWLPAEDIKQSLINTGDLVTDGKVAVTKPRVNLRKAMQTLGVAFQPGVMMLLLGE
ncbi:S8 family serine peptidase [Desulfonatronum sp. SC1]|uniref:S8 family peptidase n=1 Tax=Desulfonatronum sp. SC1 TaxID=2109626 RepID=UPI001304E1B8|nr:S8 family serine peptidase [Desulfonatronum sp. SC1]